MNVPLFILLVFLTIAYFIDEILAFFPEDVQVRYYQLWMELPQEKEIDAGTHLHLEDHESLTPKQITYPRFSYKTQQMRAPKGLKSDLVFGLNVIHECV